MRKCFNQRRCANTGPANDSFARKVTTDSRINLAILIPLEVTPARGKPEKPRKVMFNLLKTSLICFGGANTIFTTNIDQMEDIMCLYGVQVRPCSVDGRLAPGFDQEL